MRDAPAAVIEPRPRVRQRPRARRPKRSRIARSSRMAGRMQPPTDGKAAVRASRLTMPTFAGLIEKRHVDVRRRRPKGRAASARPQPAPAPRRASASAHQGARPRAMAPRPTAVWRSGQCARSSPPSTPAARDMLEPGDQRSAADRCRRPAPAPDARTSAHRMPSAGAHLPCGSPKATPFSRSSSAPKASSRPSTSRIARSGSRAKVELTIRNSLMKMPSGGMPAMATTPSTSAPAERRVAFPSAR